MNDPSSPPLALVTAAPPDDVATLRRRAAEQARAGQVSSAIATYRQALEVAPDHPSVLTDLGRLALGMGEATTAEALFSRVYEVDPTNLEAAYDLAQALRDQARYDEALEVLDGVLEVSRNEPTLWNTLGTITNAMGLSQLALAHFKQALELAPQFAAARYNRSGVLMDLGQTQAALEDCDAALAIAAAAPGGGDPGELAMMRLGRAMMLLALGRLDEAGRSMKPGWTRPSPTRPFSTSPALALGRRRLWPT